MGKGGVEAGRERATVKRSTGEGNTGRLKGKEHRGGRAGGRTCKPKKMRQWDRILRRGGCLS